MKIPGTNYPPESFLIIGFVLAWMVSILGWMARAIKDLIFNPHRDGDVGGDF